MRVHQPLRPYGYRRERLDQLEVARPIERRPWNRSGADKTWILNAMWEHLLLIREVRWERCDKEAP